MATIKDIAQKLNISPGTVSKGLNGASDISESMRQLVLDTALELGYIPKSLKNTTQKNLCILVKNMNYEAMDQFGYEIIEGFRRSAIKNKCQLTVVPAGEELESKKAYDTFMLENAYHGAFMLGFALQDQYMQQLGFTTFPTVLLDNQIVGNPRVAYIGTESQEGISDAINHLTVLGHRKIAFLNGSRNSMISEERRRYFIDSMAAHGLEVPDALLEYGHYVPDCAKYHVPGFIKAGATAIMCGSDLIASGVIAQLSLLGLRVPEDVSVIGFDDLPLSEYLNPPLTTIRQDRLALGKSAFYVLENLMHNLSVSKMLLRPQLVVRKSTAKVKK